MRKVLKITVPSFYHKNKQHYFKIDIAKRTRVKTESEQKAPVDNKRLISLDKTFNDFHQLSQELKNEKYVYIPELPQKTLIATTSDQGLEKRRIDLEDFLKELINNKELRNSREVIKFLGLNTFCPEFLVQCPQLLITNKEKVGYSINLV